jgi:hypothetical protein
MLGTPLALAALPALLAFGKRGDAGCGGRASTSGTSRLDFLIRERGVAFTGDLAAALTAAGGTVRERVYPSLGHVGLVAALAWPLRWRADVLGEVSAFVTRQPSGRATGRAASTG